MNKTISVYFSGTGFSIDETRFLSASLFNRTQESESQIKMGFNGCGVDFGFNGVIFGSGLDNQCKQVIDRVTQEMNAGHKITLNVYGHSRGGIAALLLAKQLGNVDEKKLSINLALLDPVPGNFITTSSIDPLKISLANKTMDLSDCKPLKKVLALYPHLPLRAIECHAPLIATYPRGTDIDEEVVNGCHAEAEQLFHPSSILVQLRVEEFLVQNGTQLRTLRDYKDVERMKETYLSRYQKELADVNQPVSRDAHSAQGMIIKATPGTKYLNNRHKALAGDHSPEPVALSIQPDKGLLTGSKRFFTNYPKVGQAIKWALIAPTVASLLYVTGGLAAIPSFAPMVAKLGMWSPLASSPVVGGILAASWYGAVKPVLSWCVSKFFYPQYAMRRIEAPKTDTPLSSTRKLLTTLDAGHAPTHSPVISQPPYQGRSPFHLTREMPKRALPQDSCPRQSPSLQPV